MVNPKRKKKKKKKKGRKGFEGKKHESEIGGVPDKREELVL